MPALSPTMKEGNLTKWLVSEGQEVKAGDVIAEIETDKATMEVEAVDEGFIQKLLYKEGDNNIPVNKPIAIISGDQDSKTIKQNINKKDSKNLENQEVKKTEESESNFKELNITRDFLSTNALETWSYDKLDESKRIAGIIKERIIEGVNESN